MIQRVIAAAAFSVDDFIHDLIAIANAKNLYQAMADIVLEGDDTAARSLYHPDGALDESLNAFCHHGDEKIQLKNEDYYRLANLLPEIRALLAVKPVKGLMTLSVVFVQDSVFDIAWNTLANMTASFF